MANVMEMSTEATRCYSNMAAQLLAQWGPTIVKNLPTILLAADGMYKIYRTVSDSNEEKKTVHEAMKLIEEKQGDIDRLMEDNKKMKSVLEGLTLLMDRLNQHYENQGRHHFPPSNTMAPPCCHDHHRPWEPRGCSHHGTRAPSGCHHHDTRGTPGCHHHDTRGPPGCHHHDTRGPPGCHHHDTKGPSGYHHHGTRGQRDCHHHDARGLSDRHHHPPGCHYEDPQSPSGFPCSAQELSDDDDDKDCGATSSESSSCEGSWRECCVCRRNYNLTERRPTILACGHTFCRKCLGKVAQRGPLLCPTCRTLEKRPSSLLPSNVVLMVALEEEGQRQENGTQNNDDIDDWKKKSTVLQETEELLMQMVLQISTEAEANKDEDDWKKTNALLQEEEELNIQMALLLSLESE
ncbi:uncharacterized protein LOC126995008 isoform X2 [Eriocheir sinensis]|uniref:uncharacterized protein LOC126995008 isoform X2 n=1 Tax=Eriocheir sinensis TaxID=95602 RepID=UPI0021C94D2A|nr:uncharacterized protein LOC126995008 isoform X2 [Eriocheir sinensis]